MPADWEQREGLQMRIRQLRGVTDMFKVLNVVTGSQVYVYVEIQQIYTLMGSLLYVNTSGKLYPLPPEKDSTLQGESIL